MNRTAFSIASVLALAVTSSGCVSYSTLSFKDHPKAPVTRLETLKTTWYYFGTSFEHQFWLCEDAGTKLVCKRSCGGDTDLECPELNVTGDVISSNVP